LLRRGHETVERVAFPETDYLLTELEEFAFCVRERRRPEVDGPEAIRSLSVVLATIESAASGRTIVVEHKHHQ
jgi:predicted dehydrogenase